jgi:hypothetical protein
MNVLRFFVPTTMVFRKYIRLLFNAAVYGVLVVQCQVFIQTMIHLMLQSGPFKVRHFKI